MIEAAREWSAADGDSNHRRFFAACEKLHEAVAALDNARGTG